MTMIPHKKDMITKVGRVSAAVVLGLLTVVLRGHQTKWTGRDIVGVVNCQPAAVARVVKDVPLDSADFGGAGGAVEPFHTNGGTLWR